MGGIYALTSMGLNLQYGVAKVLNVSHGEFIMYGGFITWALFGLGVHPFIALILICPITFFAGFILHRTLYERLRTVSKIPAVFESNAMLLAFGSMFILQNVATHLWGADAVGYVFMARPVNIGPSVFQANRLLALAFAIVIAILFYLFTIKTRLGKSIRATSQDPVAARLMGINIKTIMAVCFGIGAILAGIAGTLMSMYQALFSSMGMSNTIIAIIIVVLGGMGSIPGSLIGGLILGIVGTTVVTFLDPSLTLVVFYGIIIILLLVRPKGLLGR